MEGWPFDDPENVAAMTVRQITRDGQPILRASHDADDGMWQFLTGEPIRMADAMLVSLREVYRMDGSVGELADLPPGWVAERSAPGRRWRRKPAG